MPASALPGSSFRPRARALCAAAVAGALGLTGLVAAPAVAAEPTVTIAEVQGTGDASPLVGTTQTVEGVVTADYRGASGYRGIVVQTAGSGATDATPGASDGLFVFLRDADPAAELGDLVTVTGAVSEFNGLTQISSDAAGVEVVTAAAELPADSAVTAAPLADTAVGGEREALENQLVAPEGTYRIASSFQLAQGGGSAFGSLWLSAGEAPLVKSTETVDASDPANAEIAAANRANRLLLDDGYSIATTNQAHPGEQPYFSAENPVRTGDTVVFPEQPYVLSYGFDDWRLQPVVAINDASPAEYKPTFEPTNPRTEAPEEVGGDFSVGAFNVFNYFTTLTSENGDARGADTAEELAIQRSKIVSAINGLDADVVALMEIENSIKLGEPVDTALGDLVAGLNEAAGSEVWAYVPTPDALATPEAVANTDFITNAMIYKTASAVPVGDSFTELDESVWGNAREPIAQTFDVDGTVVTAVANHFKSKSGDGAEPADGQGRFNADRVAQAQAVLGLTERIAADPEKSDDIVLLGDFNAYSEEDPMQVFTDAGMVDLLAEQTDGQYTYEFNGELGSLDHAIASPSLAASVTGTTTWNINSPEWGERGFAYTAAEAGTPYRSSDHDPIKFGVTAEAAGTVNIDVVTTNDFHGRLEAAPPVAGAAVLGGMVDAYEAENPNTLFVGGGDLVGASTFTSFIQNDQPTIDALNEIGLDASALGNHEFDQGSDDVRDRLIPSADWAYLNANLYEAGTEEPAFQEYAIEEFDGVRIGFVGAVTEDLDSLVSPAGIADLDVGPVVPAVNRVADQLSDGDESNGEADVVMLLVHEGAATPDISSATDDSPFGGIVNGVNENVDAIVSAHTHQPYSHLIPIAGTDRVRPVLSAGQYGERYGHLNLQVDPATGQLTSITSEVLPLADAFAPDPAVEAIVADAVEVAVEEGSVPVGEIDADFNRATQSNGTENRGGESALGNFVADVQLWATQDAGTDVALMNPGGLRADLKNAANPATPGDAEGIVTYSEAAGVQPFANTLVALDLTTEQLKSVLEEQWQPAGSSRPFLKLGVSDSLRYTYDPNAPQGEHITGIYVDGEPAAPGATWRVAANSFLAAGGDNFVTLAEGANAADTGRIDLQSMIDYFEEFPTVSPDYAQRAVGVALSAPDADGYSAGDEVTVDLSSLLFSGSGPTAGTATVSLGDTALGSAEIDPTVVDTTDEVGRASVVMTVPEGVTGAQVLTVAVEANGTEVQVPVEFSDDAPVEPVASRTRGSADRLIVGPSQRVTYTARVTAAGETPTGYVGIYDGTRRIANVKVDQDGRVRVTLPKLSRGIHLITPRYFGDDRVDSSIGIPTPVYQR